MLLGKEVIMKQLRSLGLFGAVTLVALLVAAAYIVLPAVAADSAAETTGLQSRQGQEPEDSDSDSDSSDSESSDSDSDSDSNSDSDSSDEDSQGSSDSDSDSDSKEEPDPQNDRA